MFLFASVTLGDLSSKRLRLAALMLSPSGVQVIHTRSLSTFDKVRLRLYFFECEYFITCGGVTRALDAGSHVN
jgi:hypothetical protein